jgi:hypothetical protein
MRIAVAIWALSLGMPAQGADERPPTAVTVAQSQICVAPDLTILIKRGDQYGAVHFSGVVPGDRRGSGTANYESIFQGDGTGSFTKATAKRRSGKLEDKELVGIGRAAVQTGDTSVRVGPFTFRYDFPGCLSMEQVGKAEGDEGFRFTAVRAPNLNAVDVHAGELHWFGYELNRRVTFDVP